MKYSCWTSLTWQQSFQVDLRVLDLVSVRTQLLGKPRETSIPAELNGLWLSTPKEVINSQILVRHQ